MIIDIMIWILMALGVAMVVIAILDYLKLTKHTKENLQTKSTKLDKIQVLLNILLGVFYFLLGLFLVIRLIPAEYAFIYFIIIVLLEKMVKYLIKQKFQ